MSEEDKTQEPSKSEEGAVQESESQEDKQSGESEEKKVSTDSVKPDRSVTTQKTAGAPPTKVAKKVAKKKGPTYEDLVDNALLNGLQEKFPKGVLSGQSFLDQVTYTVTLDVLYDVLLYLRDDTDADYDYLVDLTALDHLDNEERFCLVYHLYSHKKKSFIRVRCAVDESESAPSVVAVWKTADWMEREVYDLFGIKFMGHPDLKRILLPDDWHGYPLRKDYDIKLQDQAWIGKHLRITRTPE